MIFVLRNEMTDIVGISLKMTKPCVGFIDSITIIPIVSQG